MLSKNVLTKRWRLGMEMSDVRNATAWIKNKQLENICELSLIGRELSTEVTVRTLTVREDGSVIIMWLSKSLWAQEEQLCDDE